MIRLLLEDGSWFSISPDSYDLAVSAMTKREAGDTVELNFACGGSIIVKAWYIIGVTQQSEDDLKSAWEYDMHMENLQKEVQDAMTPNWE